MVLIFMLFGLITVVEVTIAIGGGTSIRELRSDCRVHGVATKLLPWMIYSDLETIAA
jgi:hypothetical protein